MLSSTGTLLAAYPDAAHNDYFFNQAFGVAIDKAGSIYVAGNPALTHLSNIATPLTHTHHPMSPSPSCFCADGFATSNANGGTGRVVVLSSAGALLASYPTATSGYTFDLVGGLALDCVGNIYVPDQAADRGGYGRVTVLPPTGQLLAVFPDDAAQHSYVFNNVFDVAVDSSGTIFVADSEHYIGDGTSGRVVVLAGLNTACSASSSPAPSSTAAAAFSDPRFVGFWGQSFYMSGQEGGIYSLISEEAVQVNALIFYLQRIRCPLIQGVPVPRCIDHSGTYFGVLAFCTSHGDQLRITAGESNEGFHSVQLNGRDVEASDLCSISVQKISARLLVVSVGLYEVEVENMDLYLDVARVAVNCWECLVDEVRPEGLLGRTWDASKGEPASEEEVEQYRERDDNIMGCNTSRNRFRVRGASA